MKSDRYNLRKVYGETLISLAKKNKKIVSLDSDSKEATLTDRFAKAYPKRSFGFGIAEQDMVSAAGGMSTMGLIPFVNSYSMFIAMRALDQVRNSVAYPNLNVKFVLSHHGLDTGSDGVTHQLTEDIAIFRSIPNLKLLQPADAIELVQMIPFVVKTPGPFIIKVGKSAVPNVHSKNFKWKYGKPSCVAKGKTVSILAVGIMVEKALKARKRIKEEFGVTSQVINMSSLTDINVDSLLKMTESSDFIVTLEDHSIYGGLGGIAAEIFSEHRPTPMKRIGLGNHFAECGAPDKLFQKYLMDETEVVKEVGRFLK